MGKKENEKKKKWWRKSAQLVANNRKNSKKKKKKKEKKERKPSLLHFIPSFNLWDHPSNLSIRTCTHTHRHAKTKNEGKKKGKWKCSPSPTSSPWQSSSLSSFGPLLRGLPAVICPRGSHQRPKVHPLFRSNQPQQKGQRCHGRECRRTRHQPTTTTTKLAPSQESDSIIIDVEALSSAASSQASAQSLVNVVSCTQTTPSPPPPILPRLPVATAESSSFQARSSGSTARWWSLLIEQTRYLDKTPLQCGREQKKAKGEPTLYV